MAQVTETLCSDWTVADLYSRFGAVPLNRVRFLPTPGTATEDDVIELYDSEKRLYELLDGVLLEKSMGTYESFLAMLIGQLLGDYVREHDSGVLLGADGMVRLAPGLVRIPDVSFIARDRLPGGKIPRDAIADLVPDLAIEVVSKGNTAEEMNQKLADYFAASVRLVWYVHHLTREVHVYTSLDQKIIVKAEESLDGGDVLPGFRLSVEKIFAE